MFHIRENETFSGCFINDCVLIKFLRYKTRIAGGWNIFDIHLPLDAELGRRVIRFWFTPVLCRRSGTGITKVPINTVQRSGMPGITFCSAELAIQFADRYFRIASVVILNPFQFFICVCIGMLRVRSMGFIKQGSL